MDPTIARNPGPPVLRAALLGLALIYFLLLIGDHFRSRFMRALVPGPVVFFAQIADLFPESSAGIVEYRAEAWSCDGQRFTEIDMGRLFPMLAGNKENRFYRLMHFYRQSHKVLGALDAYCVRRYPAAAGISDRIGGMRFSSLILPLPKDRSEVARYVRKPLESITDARRTEWYRTPSALVAQRCSEPDPAGSASVGSVPEP